MYHVIPKSVTDAQDAEEREEAELEAHGREEAELDPRGREAAPGHYEGADDDTEAAAAFYGSGGAVGGAMLSPAGHGDASAEGRVCRTLGRQSGR